MVYRVYLRRGTEKLYIFSSDSPVQELALIEPNLHIAADSAGNFEATIPHTNVCSNAVTRDNEPWIERKITRIFVEKVDTAISTLWGGRILSVSKDFNKQPHIYAEGAYSYLCDSIQLPGTVYRSESPSAVLGSILAGHNQHCPLDKEIQVGTVTMPSGLFSDTPFVTEYESTFECIERLREAYGGHMRVRFTNELAYLDWFESYDDSQEATANMQRIDFGKNLLDFVETRDGSGIVNAIMPIGKVIHRAGAEAIGNEIPVCSTDQDGHVVFGPDSGLAFGNGVRIRAESGIAAFVYEDEVSNVCTGYWDSGKAREDYPSVPAPHTSLEVHAGEFYYVNSIAYEKTTQYIITENYLGNNPAFVRASKSAQDDSQNPTELKFHKVSIPDSQYGLPMFLNVSAIKATGPDDPIYPSDLNMSIWEGRLVDDYYDERITLKGLHDGTYGGYLGKDQNGETEYVVVTPVPEGNYTYSGKTFNKNGLYLEDTESITKYGRIEKILELSDAETPDELAKSAASYLVLGQFEETSFEVDAIDLALLDSTVESPNVLDPVRIISGVHSVDIVLPLQERDIPLNVLESQTFSIGYKKTERISKR